MNEEQLKKARMYEQWIQDIERMIENCESILEEIRKKNKTHTAIFYSQRQIAEGNELFQKYLRVQLKKNREKLKLIKKNFEEL